MTIGRREASLMTLAMLGLANTGMCTVACCRGSWGRSGRDGRGRIRKGRREPGEKGKGLMSYKERYRSTVVEAERYQRVKYSQTTKMMITGHLLYCQENSILFVWAHIKSSYKHSHRGM